VGGVVSKASLRKSMAASVLPVDGAGGEWQGAAMADGRGSSGNVIAALASFFVPGLGQLIQGRILPALLFFLACSIGYATWFLLFPLAVAAIAHLWAIIDAAIWKPQG
jgi:TM2 domain-containing membrane protein YozV